MFILFAYMAYSVLTNLENIPIRWLCVQSSKGFIYIMAEPEGTVFFSQQITLLYRCRLDSATGRAKS